MSKNVSLTVGYIDKIIARTEKLPGSLTKEERGFLETVLNSGTLPLHTKKRIEKAKILLERTNKKAYEIAELVGYSDAHYFSVTCKKITGKTPTEYAKEFKNR